MTDTKTVAPALDRGIIILKLLSESGEMSLASIAKATDFPKASLLRFLNTLSNHGWVERNESKKTYRATAKIEAIA